MRVDWRAISLAVRFKSSTLSHWSRVFGAVRQLALGQRFWMLLP